MDALRKGALNLSGFEATPDFETLGEFSKAVEANNWQVFDDEAVSAFRADTDELLKKSLSMPISDEERDNLEKATKDLSGLTKKTVTDKNGKVTTKWVRTVEVEKKDDSKGEDKHAEAWARHQHNTKVQRMGKEASFSSIERTHGKDVADHVRKKHTEVTTGKAEPEAKQYKVGDIQEKDGKRYQKQKNGKWMEVSESHGMTKEDHEKTMENYNKKDKSGKVPDWAIRQIDKHGYERDKLSDKEYDDSYFSGSNAGSKVKPEIVTAITEAIGTGKLTRAELTDQEPMMKLAKLNGGVHKVADIQMALDHMVESGKLSQTAIDGVTTYSVKATTDGGSKGKEGSSSSWNDSSMTDRMGMMDDANFSKKQMEEYVDADWDDMPKKLQDKLGGSESIDGGSKKKPEDIDAELAKDEVADAVAKHAGVSRKEFDSYNSGTKKELHSNYTKGAGEKPKKIASGGLKDHPQYTEKDYKYLKAKGWDDKKIKERWDEEHSKGIKPTTWEDDKYKKWDSVVNGSSSSGKMQAGSFSISGKKEGGYTASATIDGEKVTMDLPKEYIKTVSSFDSKEERAKVKKMLLDHAKGSK